MTEWAKASVSLAESAEAGFSLAESAEAGFSLAESAEAGLSLVRSAEASFYLVSIMLKDRRESKNYREVGRRSGPASEAEGFAHRKGVWRETVQVDFKLVNMLCRSRFLIDMRQLRHVSN